MSDELPDDFQALFRLHYPRVVRTLQSLISAPDVVEDLAQEVFVRLYRHPPDDASKVGPWLHRTCTRMAYDYLRAKHRRKRLLEQMEHSGRDEEQAPSSEHVVLQDWERSRVQGVLRRMPERDRKALWLRHSGYSYQEIAEYLQVPKEQVGTLLIRAAARFKKIYQRGLAGSHRSGLRKQPPARQSKRCPRRLDRPSCGRPLPRPPFPRWTSPGCKPPKSARGGH